MAAPGIVWRETEEDRESRERRRLADERARRVDSFSVDRSQYEGEKGQEIAWRRLRPLDGSEAAQRDRCDEMARRAKDESTGESIYAAVFRLAARRVRR